MTGVFVSQPLMDNETSTGFTGSFRIYITNDKDTEMMNNAQFTVMSATVNSKLKPGPGNMSFSYMLSLDDIESERKIVVPGSRVFYVYDPDFTVGDEWSLSSSQVFFAGTVITAEYSEETQVLKLECEDDLRYLRNPVSIVFENTPIHQAIREVVLKCGLDMGMWPVSTEFTITKSYINKTGLQIIQELIDTVRIKSNGTTQWFIQPNSSVIDVLSTYKSGKRQLSTVDLYDITDSTNALPDKYTLGNVVHTGGQVDANYTLSYNIKRSIGNTLTAVQFYRPYKIDSNGKRVEDVSKATPTFKAKEYYPTLGPMKKVWQLPESITDAKLDDYGSRVLKALCAEQIDVSITAMGCYCLRAGAIVPVYIDELKSFLHNTKGNSEGKPFKLLVDTCTHNISGDGTIITKLTGTGWMLGYLDPTVDKE